MNESYKSPEPPYTYENHDLDQKTLVFDAEHVKGTRAKLNDYERPSLSLFLWVKALTISDCKFGLSMSNRAYYQLERSRGQQCGEEQFIH